MAHQSFGAFPSSSRLALQHGSLLSLHSYTSTLLVTLQNSQDWNVLNLWQTSMLDPTFARHGSPLRSMQASGQQCI